MRIAYLIILFLPLQLMAADYERFEQNGKFGVREQTGRVVIPPTFESLGWSDGHFSLAGEITGYRKNGLWGLLNLRKQIITPAEYEVLLNSGGDRVVAAKKVNPFTTKFGCIDLQGVVAVPFVYDDIKIEGLRAVVVVRESTRYVVGLIDLQNRTIIPPQYKNIEILGSLRYAVTDFNGKIALCSETGAWITEFDIDSISPFIHDLAIFYKGWRKGLIDREGKISSAAQFRELEITGPRQARGRRADSWVIRDQQFKEVYTVQADSLTLTGNGANIIEINHRFGLVNEQFQEQAPPIYEELQSQGSLLRVRINKKFGLLRRDLTSVLPVEFDSLIVDQHTVRTLKNGQWQLFDTVGILKTPGWYELMQPRRGKYFGVRQRGFEGTIDSFGAPAIACVYEKLIEHRDTLWHVMFQGKHGIITDRDRWVLRPQDTPIHMVADGIYFEQVDSLWQLKDVKGNLLYFSTLPFERDEDGIMVHHQSGQAEFIGFDGKSQTSSPVQYSFALPKAPVSAPAFRESEGLTAIYRNGQYGFVDQRGRLRIANRYEGVGDFHEGLARVKIMGKWGFINAQDEIVIHPSLDYATDFSQGLVIAGRNRQYGIIGKDGKPVLTLAYDSLIPANNTFLLLKKNNRFGLATLQGRVLIEPRYEALQLIDDDRAIVRLNGMSGVISTEGLSIIPLEYPLLEYDLKRRIFFTHQSGAWETIVFP